MHTRYIIFGFLSFCIILRLSCNDAVVVKFTNAVCESYNKSWFIINVWRLRAISRNKTTMHFNGTILHPVYDIYIQTQMFKKANGYKPWLFNVTINGCRSLNKSYNPLTIWLISQFKEFSNFNHSCPYVGVQFVKGLYLRPKVARFPMPTGEYLLKLNWLFDEKTQFYANMYFVLEEDLL